MGRIPEHVIDDIRSRADIVEVVGSYVRLNRRGRNLFGLCPFHQEKTASFSVNPEKQIFHCFGCGKGGGSIHFIQLIENLDYPGALRFLAEKYNITLQFTASEKKSASRNEQLLEMQRIAQKHFQEQLALSKYQSVRKHLQHRGLSPITIEEFGIGYAPDDWRLLADKLKREFTSTELSESGLVAISEKGVFDRFRSRIMFPILNPFAKVLAFSGRIFEKDDPAKYVNSPETPIYKKSRVIYGLDKSRAVIRESDTVIIVEGYLDFLQLYQAGIRNVGAVSGTAFTPQHAAELRKYCSQTILAMDGDSAGVKAAMRAAWVLLQGKLDVRIMELPDGKDPDDWVREVGAEVFREASDSALGVIPFCNKYPEKENSSIAGKKHFIEEISRNLLELPDPVQRALYIKELAELTAVPEAAIQSGMQQMRRIQKQRNPVSEPKQEEQENAVGSHLEDEAIQICFSDNDDIRSYIYENMQAEWFQSKIHREIFTKLLPQLHGETHLSAASAIEYFENPIIASKLAAITIDLPELRIELAIDVCKRLEINKLNSEKDELITQLKSGASQNTMVLMQEISTLQKRISELKRQ